MPAHAGFFRSPGIRWTIRVNSCFGEKPKDRVLPVPFLDAVKNVGSALRNGQFHAPLAPGKKEKNLVLILPCGYDQ